MDLFTAPSLQIGSATADGGGHWSITASTLSDGVYSVHATATNGVGTSNPSGNLAVEVDTAPPFQPSIFDHPDDPTGDTTATFSFQAGDAPIRPHHGSGGFLGASVASAEHFECSLDASGFAPCTSPVVYTGLGLGSHEFELKSVDEAGNGSSVTSFSWTIEGGDTTPPETTIDSGPAGPTNDPSPTFNYSSSETNSTFECRLTADSQTPGPFSPCAPSGQSYSDLTDGAYTFEVRATDAAGNTDQTPAARSFTVDTAAPNPPTFDGTSPPSGSDNNNPSIFGSAESGSTVDLFTDGSCSGTPIVSGSAADFGSVGFSVSVADNTTTTFYGTAIDEAGNASDCSSVNEDSITYREISGGGGGPDPVVITLHWGSTSPTDHDLHLFLPTSPSDEVIYSAPCQPRSLHACWASLDQDNTGSPGTENITVAAADTPNPGDFYAGDYMIQVELFSCRSGSSFANSDATVTVKKGPAVLASYAVASASGDNSLGYWDIGSFHLAADGTVSALPSDNGSFASDPACDGGGARASKANDHARGPMGNGNGSSGYTTPQPQPSPRPHTSPPPSPSPSPSPSPAPSPTHAPPPPPPVRAGWISVLPLAVLPLSRLRRRKR